MTSGDCAELTSVGMVVGSPGLTARSQALGHSDTWWVYIVFLILEIARLALCFPFSALWRLRP